MSFAARLGECAFTIPYEPLDDRPPARAVVALSRVPVDLRDRPRFVRATRRVLDRMGAQDGLLGYAIRFEILGDRL